MRTMKPARICTIFGYSVVIAFTKLILIVKRRFHVTSAELVFGVYLNRVEPLGKLDTTQRLRVPLLEVYTLDLNIGLFDDPSFGFVTSTQDEPWAVCSGLIFHSDIVEDDSLECRQHGFCLFYFLLLKQILTGLQQHPHLLDLVRFNRGLGVFLPSHSGEH